TPILSGLQRHDASRSIFRAAADVRTPSDRSLSLWGVVVGTPVHGRLHLFSGQDFLRDGLTSTRSSEGNVRRHWRMILIAVILVMVGAWICLRFLLLALGVGSFPLAVSLKSPPTDQGRFLLPATRRGIGSGGCSASA